MDIKSELTEIVVKFIESDEMAQHIRDNQWLDLRGMMCVIMESRAPLTDKLAAMRTFCAKLKQAEDAPMYWPQEDVQKYIIESEGLVDIMTQVLALAHTTDNTPPGIVFTFADGNLNTEKMFTTFETARAEIFSDDYDYIHRPRPDGPPIDYDNISYKIEKWMPTQNGALKKHVSWELNHEGVIRRAKVLKVHLPTDEGDVFEDFIDISRYHSFLHVSPIHVPFQVGEIITVDHRPTNPMREGVTHAVITDMYGQGNDYIVKAVCMNQYGIPQENDLSSIVSHHSVEGFCGLHRLAKYEGILPAREVPLKNIREAIRKDTSLGKMDNIETFLTAFSSNPKNYLPHDVAVGDVIQMMRPSTRSYYSHGLIVIADLNAVNDGVDVICMDGVGLRKTTLKELTGCIEKIVFEKYQYDIVSSILRAISEELKINPTAAGTDEFMAKLAMLNRLPYIPEAHKKYNLLPECHRIGGDVVGLPGAPAEISRLLWSDTILDYPIYSTLQEILDAIERLIVTHGTENGEPNNIGHLLTEYKERVREFNIKENWAVMRYVGVSLLADIDGLTHGRYYYLSPDELDENDKHLWVLNNEESCYSICGIGSKNCMDWEIAEDPTGRVTKIMARLQDEAKAQTNE